MFRNNPFAATPTYKLILGFGLCTLGGAMLYAYFKNREEDEEKKPKEVQVFRGNSGKILTNQYTVSNADVPYIVGRCGSTLRLIEEKANVKIRFREKDANNKFCQIIGTREGLDMAANLILKEFNRVPIVKEEIYVTQSVCGKIMGRCGEAMQDICRISMAKVSVESGARGRGNADDKRRIIITGNRQQVNFAVKLIEDKIDEDERLRRSIEEAEQRREPRRSPTNSVNSSLYSSQTSLSSHMPLRDKTTPTTITYGPIQADKTMEVYVSAVASPSKFWLQLVGLQSTILDDMVAAMTFYYQDPRNQVKHIIKEPYLGQIVAAIFKYDGKWYRAEVVGILPNEYKPDEVVLDLYFVDYGDSEYVSPDEVYELRTDFLTLRFQAIECFLANVKTTIPDKFVWESAAVQKFEELTRVASWKKLYARVITYKDRPKLNNTHKTRENSPIPGVELFDYVDGCEVNIGDVLLTEGYALVCDDDYRPTSPISMQQQLQLLKPPMPSLPKPQRKPAKPEFQPQEFLVTKLQKNFLNHIKNYNMAKAKDQGELLIGDSDGISNDTPVTAAVEANSKHTLNENLTR